MAELMAISLAYESRHAGVCVCVRAQQMDSDKLTSDPVVVMRAERLV